MILLSHPTANQNVRQTALAFAEAGVLAEFWTGVNWKEGGFLDRLAGFSPRVRSELRRRSFSPDLSPFVHSVSSREWGRLVAGQLGWKGLTQDEHGVFSVDAVYRSLDQQVARRISEGLGIKAVYAYDDGACATFRAARRHGIKCLYEHPIVSWRVVRELQREEAELHPEWATTLGALRDSDEKLARKDEELAQADVVVTASTFARESLKVVPNLTARIVVIPYGTHPASQPTVARSTDGKLRVLFVGSLSQAKGLGYLMEAVAKLAGEVEFTLIGRRTSSTMPRPSELDRYHWIPSLPHHELLREMERHDVLVLPSLHEGFGMVLTEAMAQGLVVITTPHTAGPELITEGVEGFIVPIRSSAAIAEKLALLRDRDMRRTMQEAAQAKARECTWKIYRQRVIRLAREVVDRPADS
ncbi:MAG: glycosyltransferase family 4 protein [Chthoniobacterales bacterium]